jgi:1-acyl-sn-glycerol-3-phosphate acyltransferase
VHGAIPSEDAVLICPNHTNTLMDALVVLQSRHAPTVFGARADIFSQPAVAKILRFLKILPMVRRRDGIRNVLRNYETMDEVQEYLYNRPIDGKVLIDKKIKKSLDSYYAEYGVKK